MTPKHLLLGAVLGGLALFFWGFVAHMILLPQPVEILNNKAAVDAFVNAAAPTNGVYMDGRGVFVAVNMTPDRKDKTNDIGPMLGAEFATNVLQALLLTFILARTTAKTVLSRALLAVVIGLAAWVGIEGSYVIWYGVSAKLATQGFLDALGGSFVTGAVVAWVLKR